MSRPIFKLNLVFDQSCFVDFTGSQEELDSMVTSVQTLFQRCIQSSDFLAQYQMAQEIIGSDQPLQDLQMYVNRDDLVSILSAFEGSNTLH